MDATTPGPFPADLPRLDSAYQHLSTAELMRWRAHHQIKLDETNAQFRDLVMQRQPHRETVNAIDRELRLRERTSAKEA